MPVRLFAVQLGTEDPLFGYKIFMYLSCLIHSFFLSFFQGGVMLWCFVVVVIEIVRLAVCVRRVCACTSACGCVCWPWWSHAFLRCVHPPIPCATIP